MTKHERKTTSQEQRSTLLLSKPFSSQAIEDIDYVIKLNYFNPSESSSKLRSINKYATINNKDDEPKPKATKRFKRGSALGADDNKIKQLTQKSFKDKVEYERGQESRREELKRKMKGIKAEISKLYTDFDAQSKVLDNLKLELDILSNYKLYIKKEQTVGKVNKKGLNESGNNNSIIHDKKSAFYQGLLNQTNKIKSNREQKEMLILGISLEKKKIKERITELNDAILELKKEYSAINKELYFYYHQLLHEGVDTRKEGLVWIIKRIWDLGGNVILSSFPDFLDKTIIDFLFALAHKTVLLDRIYSKKAHFKDASKPITKLKTDKTEDKQLKRIKHFKANASFFISRNNAHKSIDVEDKEQQGAQSERGNSFNSTLKSSLKLLSNKSQETILCQLQELMKEEKRKMHHLVKKSNSLEAEELEERYNQLDKEINAMKRKELNRINKEFYLNDYARRYNVKQEVIISVIIGQETSYCEIKRAKLEQKEYFQLLRILKKKVQIPKELQSSLSARELSSNLN